MYSNLCSRSHVDTDCLNSVASFSNLCKSVILNLQVGPDLSQTCHSCQGTHLTHVRAHLSLMSGHTCHSCQGTHLTHARAHTLLMSGHTPHSCQGTHLTHVRAHLSLMSGRTPHSCQGTHLTHVRAHLSLMSGQTFPSLVSSSTYIPATLRMMWGRFFLPACRTYMMWGEYFRQ